MSAGRQNSYGKGNRRTERVGHREMDGQACEGNGRDERERTSQILMRFDPTGPDPQPFYYQQDHEGSVTHLTNYNNGSGQVIEKYRYDVFGAPTIMAPGGAGKNRERIGVSQQILTERKYSYKAAASLGLCARYRRT